jgi:hypothetical protein
MTESARLKTSVPPEQHERLAARAGLKPKLKLAAGDASKSVDVHPRPVAANDLRGHERVLVHCGKDLECGLL